MISPLWMSCGSATLCVLPLSAPSAASNRAFSLQGKKRCCPPTLKPSMICSPLSGRSGTAPATTAAAPATSSAFRIARWIRRAAWYVQLGVGWGHALLAVCTSAQRGGCVRCSLPHPLLAVNPRWEVCRRVFGDWVWQSQRDEVEFVPGGEESVGLSAAPVAEGTSPAVPALALQAQPVPPPRQELSVSLFIEDVYTRQQPGKVRLEWCRLRGGIFIIPFSNCLLRPFSTTA